MILAFPIRQIRSESREISDEHRAAALTAELEQVSEDIAAHKRELGKLERLRDVKAATLEAIIRRMANGR